MTIFLPADLPPFANSFIRLAVAFALGTLIGLERQYRQRTAGADPKELDAIVAALSGHDGIENAAWTVSTTS